MEQNSGPGGPGRVIDSLRRHETMLQGQFRAIEHLQARSEHLIRLTVTVLGVAIVLVTLVLRAPDPLVDIPLFATVIVGTLATTAALRAFLASYLDPGDARRLAMGPDPRWLTASTLDVTITDGAYDQGLLRMYPEYFAHNAKVLEEIALDQRTALRWLWIGMSTYAFAMFYVLWRSIPS